MADSKQTMAHKRLAERETVAHRNQNIAHRIKNIAYRRQTVTHSKQAVARNIQIKALAEQSQEPEAQPQSLQSEEAQQKQITIAKNNQNFY